MTRRIITALELPFRILGTEVIVGCSAGISAGRGDQPIDEVMRNADVAMYRAKVTLDALRQLGVRIAMDDFGTGYSSLAYLRRFPVDGLKVARELLAGPGESDDPEAWAFARAIIARGRSLNLPIVAEGIETEEQLAVLTQLGCEMGQGFLFGRPAPAALLEPRLVASTQERRPALTA